MMFFNFLNFFAIIFEFSNLGRVRTDKMEIIFVLYFSACLGPFRHEMKSGWCFLIYNIFLHLYLNFLTRVGFERIGRKFFLFSIFQPVLARFVLKWSLEEFFFNFWNFFAFIFEFSNSGWVRTDRKEILFILNFSAYLHTFRLEIKPGGFFF